MDQETIKLLKECQKYIESNIRFNALDVARMTRMTEKQTAELVETWKRENILLQKLNLFLEEHK